MYLITVIPIARGIGLEHLTYFSSQTPDVGSVVKVPVRSKSTYAIVTKVEKVSDKKSEIKNLPFGVKKLETITAQTFLEPVFMQAAQTIAEYYAATTGSVLSLLIPKVILDGIESIVSIKPFQPPKEFVKRSEILALQTDDEERMGIYKSFIREKFARKESIFLCAANREDIQKLSEILSKGIEQHTFVLHGGLSKKEIISTWKKALEASYPVLVIATGYFLCLPRADITSVIIDGENSRGFSTQSRPFIDLRTAAEILCKKTRSTLILGDQLLRLETLFRHHENEIGECAPLKSRILSEASCVLVDVRAPKDQAKREFEIITDKMFATIRDNADSGGRMFLFCARKGLAPVSLCADCGEIVSCEKCGAAMHVVSKKVENKTINTFLCHTCGTNQPTDVFCKRCGSWKLTMLGIGIDGAEREFKKKFPDIPLCIMDKDHVPGHTQAKALMKKFLETPGAVMIGTELALPYLDKIENMGVLSLDAFFGIPDFRMREKIMNLVVSLRALGEKNVIVQTRKSEEKVFARALSGNISDFYREEIAERKQFGYPPFNTFIKLTLQGSKADIRKKMEYAQSLLKPYELNIFEAFHRGIDRSYVLHGLIIIERGKWIDRNLLDKLRMLPQEFAVNVDPENLL